MLLFFLADWSLTFDHSNTPSDLSRASHSLKMDDNDDGLMLNFAPASASPAGRPKQTAKARFAQKRTAQQQRKNGPRQNGAGASDSAADAVAAAMLLVLLHPLKLHCCFELKRKFGSAPPRRQRVEPQPAAAVASNGLSAPRFDPRSASAKAAPYSLDLLSLHPRCSGTTKVRRIRSFTR